MTENRSSLDRMDEAYEKASAPRKTSTTGPVFLWLSDKQKALIRPLYNLADCPVLNYHSEWSSTPSDRINAICAAEIKKPCILCKQAQKNKKLTADPILYLPVYVYWVSEPWVDAITGKPIVHRVTYTDKTVKDAPVEKNKQGVYILELGTRGAIGAVYQYFRKFANDRQNGPITGRDFTIEKTKNGERNLYTVMHRDTKPIHPQIVAVLPTQEIVRERLFEARPPVMPVTSVNYSDDNNLSIDSNDLGLDPEPFGQPAAHQDPAISSFLQAVKNGTVATAGAAAGDALDDIGEF